MKSILVVLAISLSVPGSASGDELIPICGTSPENGLRSARPRISGAQTGRAGSDAAQSPPEITFRNGVFVVTADPAVIVGERAFDLLGHTLSVKRLTGESFALTTGPLAVRPVAGYPVAALTQGSSAFRYDLKSFSFPLGTKQYRSLFVSGNGGIYFQRPPVASSYPFTSEVAAIALPLPVVAPLLMGGMSYRWRSTQIYLTEGQGQVVVTWRFTGVNYQNSTLFGGDVQAVLSQNGDVEFSYPSFTRFVGGAPVLSTGEESVRDMRTLLATADDPASDAAPGNAAWLDLRTIAVDRQTELDRIEVRATVGESIDLTRDGLQIELLVRSPGLFFNFPFILTKGGPTVAYADTPTVIAVIEGTSIRASLLEAWIPPGRHMFEIRTKNNAGEIIDSALAWAETGRVSPRPDRDLSASSEVRMPVAEVFTVGTLDLKAVWKALSAQYGLSPDYVDAVAMYTTSPTDIDYVALSFALPGVSGADHNGRSSYGTPRYPSLLHMNLAERKGGLLHEFGHRWLFYPLVREGETTQFLSDAGHPPPDLDMTAAFTSGSSPMGGAAYIDRGGGSFETRCGSPLGFSWLELYLMGLARPEEVGPVSDFGASPENYCGRVAQISPVRQLTIQQFAQGMGGLRLPTFENSPKRFPVAFVLVESPETASTALRDAVAGYAAGFPAELREATGGRGEVIVVTPHARRRSAAH